jgi:hypothetical protein
MVPLMARRNRSLTLAALFGHRSLTLAALLRRPMMMYTPLRSAL